VPMAPPPQTNDGKRFVVLYFDLYGPSTAVAAATNFIRNNSFLHSADLVAIVTSGDEVRVVEDFTADRDKLIDDIQQLTFSGGDGVNIGRSLDGILNASKVLGSLAEQKMLVYFMPPAFHRSLSEEQIQSLIDAAQRANVAFFGMPISADLIHAGDVLSIDASVTAEAGPQATKYIEPAFDHPFTVGPDGMISVPGLGDIKAAGLTPRQLQTAILGRLVARVKTPLITVHSVTIQNRDK